MKPDIGGIIITITIVCRYSILHLEKELFATVVIDIHWLLMLLSLFGFYLILQYFCNSIRNVICIECAMFQCPSMHHLHRTNHNHNCAQCIHITLHCTFTHYIQTHSTFVVLVVVVVVVLFVCEMQFDHI